MVWTRTLGKLCGPKFRSFVGGYCSTPQEMHVPYVRLGECGGRSRVRFVTLSNGEHTLTVTGGSGFQFSALPYSWKQYADADYQADLGESNGSVQITQEQ